MSEVSLYTRYPCKLNAPIQGSNGYAGRKIGWHTLHCTKELFIANTNINRAICESDRAASCIVQSFRSRSSFISCPVWTPYIYGPTS